jgi:hypothetical protein
MPDSRIANQRTQSGQDVLHELGRILAEHRYTWASVESTITALLSAPLRTLGEIDRAQCIEVANRYITVSVPSRYSGIHELHDALHMSLAGTVYGGINDQSPWHVLRHLVTRLTQEAMRAHEGVWGKNLSDLVFFLVAFAYVDEERFESFCADCLVLAYVGWVVVDDERVIDVHLCGVAPSVG